MSRAEMEKRREAAIVLFDAGMYAAAVARVLGVSRTTALRWRDLWRGGKSLRSTKATGRPRSVPLQAIAELVVGANIKRPLELQLAIAIAHGRTYDLDYCGRLLKAARSHARAVAA